LKDLIYREKEHQGQITLFVMLCGEVIFTQDISLRINCVSKAIDTISKLPLKKLQIQICPRRQMMIAPAKKILIKVVYQLQNDIE